MALTVGARLGPYEIVGALGAGGMGEVYRARDPKLNRDVAIKVLLPEVADDPDRLARFSREAQVLASLNHPNIAHIYGLEGRDAIVMELVDGPTLADRIALGPIPLDDALPIAKQIADALAAAHEKGIVHRDLKPANIKVTADGHVKVLDFGLAKAIESPSSPQVSNSPTVMRDPSMPGMLIGTAAYMSPEQAKGRGVDKRTDIFAFGCVLYEMLTAAKAFQGDDVTDILSAVLRVEPDWSRLPANVPSGIQTLLRLCLEKNVKNRRSDATDVRLDIEQALNAPHDVVARPSASAARERIAWALAATSLIAAVALAVLRPRTGAAVTASDVTRVAILPPPDATLEADTGTVSGHPSVSPDGRKVAFVSMGRDGQRILSLRDLAAADAHVIPNTKGADRPFWSPDGRYIGFVANGQLQKITVSGGGASEIICAMPSFPFGATWNRDGVIVFSSAGSLYRVDARGGRSTILKERTGLDRFMYPQFLPDGRTVLYTAVSGNRQDRGAFIVSLDGAARRVADADYKVVYSHGHLLSVQNGDLFAQPFDASRAQLSGEARRLQDRVAYVYNAARDAWLDASDNGTLVYVAPMTSAAQLLWLDRSGAIVQKVGPIGEYRVPVLSPDARRLAFDRMPPDDDGRKVWVMDLETGAMTRVTSHGSNNWAPMWSPDGRTLVFSSDRDGPFPSLYEHAADGEGADRLLVRAEFDTRAQHWSTHGIVVSGGAIPHQLVTPADGTLAPLPNTGAFRAQFSPDGKFVAYDSNESGTSEIYIRRFPISSERWRASLKGGMQPLWRADGQELFYLDLDGKLIAAKIQLQPQVNVGREETLFQSPFRRASEFQSFRSVYAVAPDGSKFLFPDRGISSDIVSMTVVLNWPATLQ